MFSCYKDLFTNWDFRGDKKKNHFSIHSPHFLILKKVK